MKRNLQVLKNVVESQEKEKLLFAIKYKKLFSAFEKQIGLKQVE